MKISQNLVVLKEPSEDAFDNSLKAGNMFLNRFCIDEDAAFELSGVNFLQKSSKDMAYGESKRLTNKRKVKGKEYPFLQSETF